LLAIKTVIKENRVRLRRGLVMKSKKTTVFIAAFTVMIILITVSPVLCADEKQTVSKESATYTDPEKTIQSNVGGTFLIVLDSNPSTGYQWQLTQSPNREFLKLINSTYRAPITELAGAGGKEIWSFKALSVGQRTIVFEYVRPWEKNKEPLKSVIFTVNIQ
jgi:inhibitor of cysteine peptidase